MNTDQTTLGAANVEPQELQKLRVGHALELRRLVIDRLLLGAIVGIAAFAASIILERFKQTTSDTRYFLEKRLEAGTAVRASLSDVTSELFLLAAPACQLELERPRLPVEKLNIALSSQVKILNSSSLLFTKAYLDDASQVVNIFFGLAAAPSHIPCESRQLVAALADYMTHRTREEVLPGSVSAWSGFTPLPLSAHDVERMGSMDYAKKNLERWKALNPQK